MSYLDFILPDGLEAPSFRAMNNNPNDDFVAIDFETLTSKKTSACAIGMVRVIDGHIVQRFYSLINPIRDEDTIKEPNIGIHGIKLHECEKAPTFEKIFPIIRSFIGELKIICHNAPVDINILGLLMAYYKLSGINLEHHACTYNLTGLSLEKACERFGISLHNHHDALSDAEASALIYLHLIGQPSLNVAYGNKKTISNRSRASITGLTQMLDESEILDKSNIFFNSGVVITGVFDKYPDRLELAEKIRKLGAHIHTSITKKVNIVVAGDGCGPKKIEKVQQLKEQGASIRIIVEAELNELLAIHGL